MHERIDTCFFSLSEALCKLSVVLHAEQISTYTVFSNTAENPALYISR